MAWTVRAEVTIVWAKPVGNRNGPARPGLHIAWTNLHISSRDSLDKLILIVFTGFRDYDLSHFRPARDSVYKPGSEYRADLLRIL